MEDTALVIALAMVLSMGAMTAFASENSTTDVKGSIKVENPQKEPPAGTTDSTYTAYKVFDVTYADGDSTTTDLYAYTITNTTTGGEWFDIITASTTPDTNGVYTMTNGGFKGLVFTPVAAGGGKYNVETTSDFSAPAFAEALKNALTSATAETAIALPYVDGTPTASNLDLGYYFVTTTTGSLCNLTTTHPNELIYDKNEVPPLDKVILEEDGDDADTDPDEVKNNNAAIGDEVEFQITTKVPSMVGYNRYYYIITDTLSKGLDLLDDDTHPFTVSIAAGDPAATYPAIANLTRVYLGSNGKYYTTAAAATSMTEGTDIPATSNSYYITTTKDASTGETTFKLVFVNFIQYLDNTVGTTNTDGTLGSSDTNKGYTDAAITVKYKAQVDEDAVIGKDGNDNKAKLTYSNNPTDTGNGEGTPDEPKNPQGTTPEIHTKTYVTAIKLIKYDAQNTTKYLEGAQFQITATNLLNTVIESGERFQKSPETPGGAAYVAKTVTDPITGSEVAKEVVESGTYYKLNDGTYTTTAPSTGNEGLYESTTDTYVKVTGTWVVTKPASGTATYIATTDSNGNIQFTGLKAGEYTITELIAPDGYNLLTKPLEVTISANYKLTAITDTEDTDKVSAVCKWSAVDADNNELNLDENNNIIEVEVPNNSGTTLPSTGGIGTTIFYVIGAILVIGAGVVLITRRRMEA